MSDESFAEVVYRWHQVMFRLDELDETEAVGMTVEEANALEAERVELQRELQAVEGRLGQAQLGGLRASHELDRAYARQMRQMEEEAEDNS